MRTGVRGYPSWPGLALRPDTLMQTDHAIPKSPLADGAGHTFFKSRLGRGILLRMIRARLQPRQATAQLRENPPLKKPGQRRSRELRWRLVTVRQRRCEVLPAQAQHVELGDQIVGSLSGSGFGQEREALERLQHRFVLTCVVVSHRLRVRGP